MNHFATRKPALWVWSRLTDPEAYVYYFFLFAGFREAFFTTFLAVLAFLADRLAFLATPLLAVTLAAFAGSLDDLALLALGLDFAREVAALFLRRTAEVAGLDKTSAAAGGSMGRTTGVSAA